jgi:hypothetical protein
MDLLRDLKKMAIEYKDLKSDNEITKYLNSMNFKLGYLIFLSFYQSLNDIDYEKLKLKILKDIIRLGMVYIITGNSKLLSNLIPNICVHIQGNKATNYNELYSDFKDMINIEVKKILSQFTDVLHSANLYRKKKLTSLLLNIINFHFEGTVQGKNTTIEHIMPQNIDFEICSYEGITDENINLHINKLGNLTLATRANNSSYSNICFKEKIKCLNELQSIYITKSITENITVVDTRFILAIESFNWKKLDKVEWGKSNIDLRSLALTNVAILVLIEDNFLLDFFE